MTGQEILGLIILLLTFPLLFYLTSRIRAGKEARLRPMPGMEELPGSVGRAAETAQPLHVSVGVEGVSGVATAQTWAGLTLLRELADEAAACDTPLIVTVADPTALPVAQGILRRAYLRNGAPDSYDPRQVRFVAPVPIAYAAGVAGLLERESFSANVMVGAFGLEYLLMGEVGARQKLRQIVGAAEPDTLPFVLATADRSLIGEEMFATGAYTTRLPSQIASALAEDWARWLVIIGILVAALYKIVVS
jgi:hypothetical protein